MATSSLLGIDSDNLPPLHSATGIDSLGPSDASDSGSDSAGAYSDEPDSEMVKRLIVECGVATIPLSAFYTDGTDNKLIRLSFAKDEATLRAGAQALCRVKPR